MRVVAAAALYFLIVFGAGFLLGPVRVFLLEPRFGEAVATLFEAPFILVVIVVAARRLAEALGLKPLARLPEWVLERSRSSSSPTSRSAASCAVSRRRSSLLTLRRRPV